MTTDGTALLAELRGSKIGEALLAERAARLRAARQALVDRREAILRDLEAERRRHEKPIATARAAEAAAGAKHRQAVVALQQTEQAARAALGRLEADQRAVEAELRTTADTAIDQARETLERRWAVVQGQTVTYSEPTDRYYVSGTPVRQHFSNAAAAGRICHAVVQARQQLEALKLANPDDLAGAVAAIFAVIPFDEIKAVEVVG